MDIHCLVNNNLFVCNPRLISNFKCSKCGNTLEIKMETYDYGNELFVGVFCFTCQKMVEIIKPKKLTETQINQHLLNILKEWND